MISRRAAALLLIVSVLAWWGILSLAHTLYTFLR